MQTDYGIGGIWGSSIQWSSSTAFDNWTGDEEQLFDVTGFKQQTPKVGQTLSGDFNKSIIVFKFVSVERCRDPSDMFFAKVKPFKQMMKFPILGYSRPTSYIDISVLNEEYAQKNHGQTLQRLLKRGGLSDKEIVANIKKLKLRDMDNITDEYIDEFIKKLIICVHI
jgi:hypothetical protein